MEWTSKQRKEFSQNGSTLFRNVVPALQIRRALRLINESMWRGLRPAKMDEYRATSFFPKLRRHSWITDLILATPLWEAIRHEMLPGNIKLWGGGQIAIRFPTLKEPDRLYPHLDGMPAPMNRVSRRKAETFSALIGIFLSDLPQNYWGNFTVWPGTHRMVADYFAQHPSQTLRNSLPPLSLPEPLQITAGAGDAIVCHYLTLHTAATNVSPYIRYAVFFRLMHEKHRGFRNEILRNPGLEWPTINL